MRTWLCSWVLVCCHLTWPSSLCESSTLQHECYAVLGLWKKTMLLQCWNYSNTLVNIMPSVGLSDKKKGGGRLSRREVTVI